MMEALVGNRNVQNVLLFLFVNGRCYGTQLHKQLKNPLTPIQKALSRLESGSVIISYFEGKTRLYQFNPAFPLLDELEQLLKKAYTLLPPQEKKLFYIAREERHFRQKNKNQALLSFWQRLSSVKQLTFQAKSKSNDEGGWNGKGSGQVTTVSEEGGQGGDKGLIFHEKGSWKNKRGGEVTFSNVFRWRLDRSAQIISLEHLRRGPENPVFLFHLTPTGPHSLSSVDSHLCEGDTYFGQIHFDRYTLRLNWRVIGPKKNEEIDYYYS